MGKHSFAHRQVVEDVHAGASLFFGEESLLKKVPGYFSNGEVLLWAASALLIVIAFAAFDRENGLTLTASLIGVTSLIFNAKGHPAG